MPSVTQQSIKKKKFGSFITILFQLGLWRLSASGGKKKNIYIYIYLFHSNRNTAHFKPLLYNTSVSTIKLWPCSHDNTDFAEFLPIVLRKTPTFKADDERQDSQKTTLLSKTCKEHWWEEGAFLVTDRPEQQHHPKERENSKSNFTFPKTASHSSEWPGDWGIARHVHPSRRWKSKPYSRLHPLK